MGHDSGWNIEDLKTLYKLREQGKSWEEIADVIKTKSWKAIARKFGRINWPQFLKNPKLYSLNTSSRKWTNEEMIQLDAYLQAGQSYDFIAEKLNRSFSSVESQAQHTEWKAWREIQKTEPEVSDTDDDEEKKKIKIDQYTNALLRICRFDFERVDLIREDVFLKKVNLDKAQLFISFSELKERARKQLIMLGYGNPESLKLSTGTYVIVGDSHGKHTGKKMFGLLKEVNKFLKPTNIIHIGHILDDDNDISYDWGNFDNLIILAKMEELKTIQEQRTSYKFHYDIVREAIVINDDLFIMNQDIVSDHVKTSISSLDPQIFGDKAVVNCHRVEFSTRCFSEGASFFASPGCLCENHITRTIKQIDFQEGKIIKQANYEGFSKYRRMKHTNKYWENGLLVVQVSKDGAYTVLPCPIKMTSKGFTTSIFDKMVTSSGVFEPDKKIFVNGDMHCDKHDINVLDIQEQICQDYKPDVQVNVGDTFNYSSLNHHIMDRGGIIIDKKILDEAAQTHYILKRVSKWAKESYLIYGNHERFANDFVEKYPQFGMYLDFRFICDLEHLGYKLIPLKNVLKIGSTKFIHGEMKMFGQVGSKLEKAARTFGRDIFIGHIHRPEIRLGCYSVGLTGCLDQEYNEPDASNWIHGFGLCNQYLGKSWPTTVTIIDNTCAINGKTYRPKNPKSWETPPYKAKIHYEF